MSIDLQEDEDKIWWVLCSHHCDTPELVYGEGADFAALNWVAEFEQLACEYSVMDQFEELTVNVYTDDDYQKAAEIETTDWTQIPHETFVVAGEVIPHYYLKK